MFVLVIRSSVVNAVVYLVKSKKEIKKERKKIKAENKNCVCVCVCVSMCVCVRERERESTKNANISRLIPINVTSSILKNNVYSCLVWLSVDIIIIIIIIIVIMSCR